MLESQDTSHLQKCQTSLEISLCQSFNYLKTPKQSPQVSCVFVEMHLSEL